MTETLSPPSAAPSDRPLQLAVIGAGPVGIALALQAARSLPEAQVTLCDARPLERDVSGDPRTLALSLGSVQLLERLQAWDPTHAEAILAVHVSQQPPTWSGFGPEPALEIRAAEEGVAMLGAVLPYGRIVAPLQAAWLAEAARAPGRLHSRFGTPVAALKNLAGHGPEGGGANEGVEIDAGIAERFDLAVVAEGGVFSPTAGGGLQVPERATLRHDYRQTAWVGTLTLSAQAPRGTAYERFTRHGPAALLPLPDDAASGTRRAALVWCVASDDDPVRALDDAQRLAVLGTVFHPSVGPLLGISALKAFPLGLQAERSLVDGRIVRIGNAAQTLHPVAGQGLNLGLRDAYELVRALAESRSVAAALRRVEWRRAPDRWSMIAATDFLARSFTWRLPGAGAARGLGLAALQRLGPVRSALARHMMYGQR